MPQWGMVNTCASLYKNGSFWKTENRRETSIYYTHRPPQERNESMQSREQERRRAAEEIWLRYLNAYLVQMSVIDEAMGDRMLVRIVTEYGKCSSEK